MKIILSKGKKRKDNRRESSSGILVYFLLDVATSLIEKEYE
jgi:hypothetical protein